MWVVGAFVLEVNIHTDVHINNGIKKYVLIFMLIFLKNMYVIKRYLLCCLIIACVLVVELLLFITISKYRQGKSAKSKKSPEILKLNN